jgi:competence protein ComEC
MAPVEKDGAPRWDPGAFAGKVQLRLGELFPNEGGLVEALVLARKEGLSPDLRESFARAGTAHLLAISGFHVGVVAGLLLLAGSWMGLSHRRRLLLGSGGVWGYVLFIGLPDAALRAALILTLLSLGRLGHRHVAPLGALASSFLFFLFLDPGAVLRPGFQLSFAGATGLVLWARPIARAVSGVGRSSNAVPYLSSSVAAGVSATLATVPLVAWHFGRVSLVGIPVTLLAAPMVTLAIPGIFLCLVASFASWPLGSFLAHGVEADLWLFRSLVDWAGTFPLASLWVSRPGVVAGVAGMALARLLWSVLPRERRWGRRTLLGTAALAGLILWPVADRVAGWGTLEMVVLDVGQGDAILLRSPRGRWILVDAGPRTERYDAGARAVLPYLRRRGAGGLELMVLTHPDMDHVGGAGAILREYPVGGVMDPGMAVGTGVFLDALEGAQARDVPWTVGAAGDSLDLDGVAIRVLWPPEEKGDLAEADGANGVSLVLEVRLGSFSALLTGDAPAEVEETLLPRLLSPSIQVLKLGHHGSRTSTSPELLERITPEVALISAGLRNRFGHPHAAVLRRLEARGVKVYRTDQDGTLTLQARKDGSYRVRQERGGAGFESIPVDPRKR